MSAVLKLVLFTFLIVHTATIANAGVVKFTYKGIKWLVNWTGDSNDLSADITNLKNTDEWTDVSNKIYCKAKDKFKTCGAKEKGIVWWNMTSTSKGFQSNVAVACPFALAPHPRKFQEWDIYTVVPLARIDRKGTQQFYAYYKDSKKSYTSVQIGMAKRGSDKPTIPCWNVDIAFAANKGNKDFTRDMCLWALEFYKVKSNALNKECFDNLIGVGVEVKLD